MSAPWPELLKQVGRTTPPPLTVTPLRSVLCRYCPFAPGPELLSKWVGESEKAVQEVFRKARASSPCVIFFDEIDAVAAGRSSSGGSDVLTRVVSQLLHELDGVTVLKKVVVVAATNRPDLLDPAFLRPGRIDRMLYIGPPDELSRAQILSLQVRRCGL